MIAEFMTVGGMRVDILDLRPEQVRLTDVAHHLAWTCRYNAAVDPWYSNAQHSVLVSELVALDVVALGSDTEEYRWGPLVGLAHDTGETYTGDLTNPMKTALRFAASLYGMTSPFDVIEDRVLTVMELAFGLPARSLVGGCPLYALMKRADKLALKVEDSFLRPHTKTPFPENLNRNELCITHGVWERDEAKEQFLARFRRLADEAGATCV